MLPSYLEERIGKCRSLREALTALSLAKAVCTGPELVRLGLEMWDIPLQVEATVQDVLESGSRLLPAPHGGEVVESVLDRDDDRAVFPLKLHPGAATKVNVFFRDVWVDAKKHFSKPAAYLSRHPELLVGLFNDQASAWVIWFCLAWEEDPRVAVSVLHECQNMDYLKELSDTVKALGITRTKLGCLCTELKTMACRGAKSFDPDEEVRCRINKKAFKAEKSCGITGEQIRPYVRQVLQEEMAKNPEWAGTKDYWQRRWLYTRSGAHARRVEDIKLGGRLDLPERPTRREFAEAVSENMVAKGEPGCHAGQSSKLENGSTRAIYAGDSINYFTFDYLLRPIEAVWRNRSCLLDPGARQPSELYGALSAGADVNLMVDFEDYNSQHEKSAMRVVIEEACAGAPKEILDWALASFDNEVVYWVSADGTTKWAVTVGSLFSGHRATTFINTVLNSAYIRYVCNTLVLPMKSYHAGDDVYLSGTADQVEHVMKSVLSSSVRVNRSKQGCGRLVGEFLRTAFTRECARGYMARSVSSLVSGNWVSEQVGTESEDVANYARQGWTLMVRSGCRRAAWLLRTSMERRLPRIAHLAGAICDFRLSVGGSPVLDRTGGDCEVLMFVKEQSVRPNMEGKPSHATDDFLDNYVKDELLEAANMSRESMRKLMLEVSYKPEQREEGKEAEERPVVCPVPKRSFYGVAIARQERLRDLTRTESAVAKLLGRLVNSIDWEALVRAIVGDKSVLAPKLDPKTFPVTNAGTLGVSELMALRSRSARPICVATRYPILI
ncbi:RNA dependent RNA polymerase [Diatom colony associated dsRNA virus 4 genome type B]|uniref:RNA dependent RNA polymerase n=1 Tax=Diatom colony associated dsRNA virus 4 genome type B TaxID=1678163 RepID=UPI0007A65D66|nr:RNA dependent RNA polymerase [Diatom colony associated dsRNA virus 4 genome type B]BAU79490.1 RNA dependent RNA polymerase [Diatom colony associated dsRNA virus 4 genome type B]